MGSLEKTYFEKTHGKKQPERTQIIKMFILNDAIT